jgi:predicted lipoprotein with Yx(FWY)xxD motif
MRKSLFCLSTLTLLAAQQAAFAEAPKVDNGRFVTADGMSLYTFDKDTTPGVSACTGGCMKYWPAAVAASGDKPSGDWTLIPTADGKQQWAYKGHPLYRYAADKQAGDTKGDGFKDVWHAAKP